jgi:pantetheine-phosphate adenylyltransferase
MKKIAIYPGTFKPFHEGHLTILEKALKVFDEVYVVPSINIRKKDGTEQQTREAQINAMVKHLHGVHVVTNLKMLTVDFAVSVGAQFIIRGLRSKKDLEYELDMYDANKMLNQDIETVYFVANLGERKVSSTTLREIELFQQMLEDNKENM